MLPFSAVAGGVALGSVALAWNPSISTNVVGYNIYYGVACGVYNNTISAGNSTNVTVTGLAEGTTYYFAATAVDALGVESPFSNETSYSVPINTPPAAPPTLDPLTDLTIYKNAGLQTVKLSGINGALNQLQPLTVTAVSSNPGLIPNPAVNYTSPNATGTLSFSPASGNYGTATITITVNNNGASNNLCVRSFTVTVNVNAVNLSPTPDSLNGGIAPSFLIPPQTQTAEAGTIVNLAARVTGNPPPAYQWFFNGNAVASGTNRLCLSGIQASNIGAYTLVISNVWGAATSAPALLNVIAPVERRPVPAVNVTAAPGSSLGIEYCDDPGSTTGWRTAATMTLSNASQFFFDVSEPLPPHRLYRVWRSGTPGAAPSLNLNFVPAIALTGTVGSPLRLDCINAIGPTNAWVTLETVTLTNTSQLYFDVSALNQSGRLYRIVPIR